MLLEVEIGLRLGKWLVKEALKKLMAKKVNSDDRQPKAIVVLEVGRKIRDDVEVQLGNIDAVIQYGLLKKEDLHRVAAEVYTVIAKMQRFYREIVLVLSGPVVLSFFIGQCIGMNHYKIKVAFWQQGTYEVLEDMTTKRLMLLG